jgi:hypothetical protein
MNFRMLPPVAIANQIVVANGRSYTASPGSFLDVPDNDAEILGANGWTRVCLSGATAARPTTNPNSTPPYVAAAGLHFYDTTIAALVIFDGSVWRTIAGVSA